MIRDQDEVATTQSCSRVTRDEIYVPVKQTSRRTKLVSSPLPRNAAILHRSRLRVNYGLAVLRGYSNVWPNVKIP